MINDELHVVHARAAGLDVHKLQITAAVRLCEPVQPEPRCETRSFSTLPNGLRQLRSWLLEHQVQAAAIESTGIYWTRPLDLLNEAGIEVKLYHPQQVKQLRGRKTDIQDARWLARVCQFGLGRTSYVPSKFFRDLRQLSRYRRQLVAQRSQIRNQVHKLLDGCGLLIGGILSDVFGMNGRRILAGIACGRASEQILDSLSMHVRDKRERFEDALQANLSETMRYMLGELLSQHDSHEARIQRVDLKLKELLQPYQDQLDLMCTIPGIKWDAAAALFIEFGGDLSEFLNARSFAAWSGTVPGNNESAGKRRSGQTRQGNPHVRAITIETAHAAARCKGSQYQFFHRALTVRRGYKRATVATAHKMVRTLYAVLRDQKPYRDPQADYEQLLVRRNAPRWVRELKKFGILSRNREGSYVLDWSMQLNL